jgi:hypothetical protein
MRSKIQVFEAFGFGNTSPNGCDNQERIPQRFPSKLNKTCCSLGLSFLIVLGSRRLRLSSSFFVTLCLFLTSTVGASELAEMRSPPASITEVDLPAEDAPPPDQVAKTRICRVYTSGSVYCVNILSLIRDQWNGVSAAALQKNLHAVFASLGIDSQLNGLIDCGDNKWAGAHQSVGQLPSQRDVQGALDACMSAITRAMSGRPSTDPTSLMGGVNARFVRVSPGSSSCATGDPRVSTGTLTSFLKVVHALTTSKTLSELGEILIGHFADPVTGTLAPFAGEGGSEFQRSLFTAMRAKWTTEYLQTVSDDKMGEEIERLKAMTDAEWLAYVKSVTPVATAPQQPTSGRPTPSDGGTCAEAAAQIIAFLENCTRTGWQSYGCQKLKTCSDPAITTPGPDQPGVYCSTGSITIYGGEEAIEKAVIAGCRSKVQYVPGSEDVCKRPSSGGMSQTTVDVCNSPLALITQEGCGNSVELTPESMTPLIKTVGEKIAAIRETLCGKRGVPCPPPINVSGGGLGGPVPIRLIR